MERKRLVYFRVVKPFIKHVFLAIGVSLCISLGQVVNLCSTDATNSASAMQPPSVVAVASPVDTTSQTLPNLTGLLQQGKDLYETGKFAEAAKVCQQAAQAFQSQGDKLNQAIAFSFLSLAYQQLGQWNEAGAATNSSLQLLKETGLQPPNSNTSKDQLLILAQVLTIRGQLQLKLGQAENAIATWQQATTAYTQANDPVGTIGSLINQAQAMQALGLYRQAEKTLTQVKDTLQNQPDSIKVMGLRSLGNTLRVIGDLDQSRKALQESLSIARSARYAIAQQLKSSSDISATLLSLGNTARAQRDTKAALGFYQQAATASTSPITRTQAQLNQLSILIDTQQANAASTLVSQIQTEVAQLPPSRAAVYAQINFAQSLTKLRQTGSANTLSSTDIGQILARAVQQAKSLNDTRAEAYALGYLGNLYEQTQQLSNAQGLTEQALLIAQSANASDIAYRWQWQLGRLLKAQGKLKSAISAYSEAVNTLQSLRSDLVSINPDVQFSFREEVEPVYRQLVDLLLQPPQSQAEPDRQNLIQARRVIESLQLAELDNFFRAACLQGQIVQIDQVIDRDDPTAAVIYPIILPDRLEVILKLPNRPLMHYKSAIAQDEVEKAIDKLRRNLTTSFLVKRAQDSSRPVYDWLIRPAQEALAQSQIKTLVFVLDGVLRNVPMAALYDGQQYLVQKYSIALTPGLQLLAPKSLERRQLKTLTAGLTEARLGFAPLSNVANEVQEIQTEVPSTVILDREFTSANFQDKLKSLSFPVVHLATHGQFSSQAEETFILTWDAPLYVNQLDNVLRDRNQSQPRAIELLVLSACQTATGDKRAALGLAGVAVRAGARSTLASLWSINDRSTSILMSQFYRELAQTNVSKAEALRQAQLTLLQNPQYKFPLYWSPFVLVGNWL